MFRRITPAELASKELADAELQLLADMTHRDHAQASIDYNQSRIKRLKMFLAKLEAV